MNICRRTIGIIGAILAVVPLASAQKVGTTSMQFLKVMPCARGTAMGDAYTTFAEGAEAVFWNPGGVGIVQRPEVSSTYIDWIFDTQLGSISYAMPLEDLGAVGLQLQYIDYGVFDEAVATGSGTAALTGRQFHPFAYLVGITYARSMTERFSTGLSIKYAHESLYDKSTVLTQTALGTADTVNTYGRGVLFDFGLRYNTGFRTVVIAASVQNFGASIRYAREANPTPLLFRLGVGADVIGTGGLLLEDSDNRVSVEFDLFQPNDYTQQMHAGIEYSFGGFFALRAGYKFNYDSEGFTAGGGIRKEFGGVLLSIDYAYAPMGIYLGKAHRISLGAGL